MSHVGWPEDPSRLPWVMTLGEMGDRIASESPDKVFLSYHDQQVSYGQFRERSLEVAGMFREMGVRHGDRVCTLLPNGLEFPYVWMGLARLGAICVTINTAFKGDEVAYILNDAETKLLVCHHSLLEAAESAAANCPSLEETIVVNEDGGKNSGLRDFWTLLREAEPMGEEAESAVTPQDVSMLVYTSGTTGNPKGVMITHQMYVAAGQGFATWTESTSKDRFFTCLPYFHANAQYYTTMGCLAAGATLVLEDRFSASRFLDQVCESRATVVNFIGMMVPALLKQPIRDGDADNSVRVYYGSPAPPLESLHAFEERFGGKILAGFGLTETCYGTIERIGEPHRKGSSGRAKEHPDPRFQAQVRIVTDGESLPPGQTGEITLRSPANMPGYWRNPERTQEALRDGWFYTGDLGWIDEDGYLYFVDRKKDVVRRRGENISSQEVENCIRSHPGVADCAVIAVPAELGEEEVKVYVVARPPSDDGTQEPTPEDIVYWCAERLAYFKVPRYVEFRQDLPRTPSFRVRKDVLRQERDDLISGCFDREKAGIRLR